MKGMSIENGAPLDGIEHLMQSLRDILSTPLGSRVMRRDYGSLVADLIDQAANGHGQMLLKAVCAHAIAKWEPRAILKRIALSDIQQSGHVTLDIDMEYVETGAPVTLRGLVL